MTTESTPKPLGWQESACINALLHAYDMALHDDYSWPRLHTAHNVLAAMGHLDDINTDGPPELVGDKRIRDVLVDYRATLYELAERVLGTAVDGDPTARRELRSDLGGVRERLLQDVNA